MRPLSNTYFLVAKRKTNATNTDQCNKNAEYSNIVTRSFLGVAWCDWVWLQEPEHEYGKTGCLVDIPY